MSEVRIEEATELFSDPDFKIIDISLALGYEDRQNFSRIFRRMTGMSPSHYRRSIATTT